MIHSTHGARGRAHDVAIYSAMVAYVILKLVSVVAPSASARKTRRPGLDLSQHGGVAYATA